MSTAVVEKGLTERDRRFYRLGPPWPAGATLLCAFAAFAIIGLWEHYMVAPWTRDGQVRVQVADIAPSQAIRAALINTLGIPSDDSFN
jgi:hypothetical protein